MALSIPEKWFSGGEDGADDSVLPRDGLAAHEPCLLSDCMPEDQCLGFRIGEKNGAFLCVHHLQGDRERLFEQKVKVRLLEKGEADLADCLEFPFTLEQPAIFLPSRVLAFISGWRLLG